MKQTLLKAFPTLITDKLLLRQFASADLENVFRGLSNPDIIKYYGVNYATLAETKAQMEFFANLERNETGLWWAICSLEGDIFYGAGGLNNLNKFHKKAEIGFWLFPKFWGQGIMTEAMPIICNYGFNDLALHRIEGFVESENLNSKKLMAKLNFQYEGTMRECEIKDGKLISLDIYAKLNGNKVFGNR